MLSFELLMDVMMDGRYNGSLVKSVTDVVLQISIRFVMKGRTSYQNKNLH